MTTLDTANISVSIENINAGEDVDISNNTIDLEKVFNSSIKTIPLVNNDGVLKAVAESKSLKIKIGNKLISNSSPAFIIAEIGNNHQGDINIAKKLVDECLEAGVDCVKFQMRTMKNLYAQPACHHNQKYQIHLGF